MKSILFSLALLVPPFGHAENANVIARNCGLTLEGPYKQKLVFSGQGVLYKGRIYASYERQATAYENTYIYVIFLPTAQGEPILFCPEPAAQ